MTQQTQVVRQLSDNNSQGTVFGQSPADKIGFYGMTSGVAQPSNPGTQTLGQLTSANNGVIMKYQTALQVNSMTATSANTATLNQTTSVTTTLQPGVIFATNSVYALNKPTLQAGLGFAGVTCATTGIINVGYINVSSGAITPTQEANDVIEVKAGPLTTTAALTPAPVAQNTTVEQIFNITGNVCLPGSIAIVNKPTAQASLAVQIYARVVGINQVGITFGAVTSGAGTSTPVVPTAAETYSFPFLPQLNAFNPTYIYGIPSGATANGASTTLEQTSGVTGILASDTISGISRGTTQVGIGIASFRVTSAGVIGITYVTPGATITPTTSEVLLATIQRQTPLNPFMIYSQALATSAIAATTSAEVTTAVAGLLVSSSVIINKPTCTPGLLIANARVVSSGVLGVQYMNLTTTSINVPSETYLIGNVQLQGPGTGLTTTAGLFVAQSYYPAQQQAMTFAAALRSALLALNLIAGT